MCGSVKQKIDGDYWLLVDKAGVVWEKRHKDEGGFDVPIVESDRIAPTENLHVIHDHDGKRWVSDMRWWLTPHWSDGPTQKYAMFNARAETIEKSPAYKGPFQYRRAIIPAQGFYEWRREGNLKQPYLIEPDTSIFALAAVWDSWSDGTHEILSCSIITTEASSAFSTVHNRMPVILDWDHLDEWLDEKTDIQTIKGMLKPYKRPLYATKMNPRMNNARNKEAPEAISEREALISSD